MERAVRWIIPRFPAGMPDIGKEARDFGTVVAVQEAAERAVALHRAGFSSWLGASLVGEANPAPRFASNDDLWGET